ncbi:CgeB family protein [Numidum massiliense]|uniref:CgeB family protein n=1 Tax=Numidum massiliense TaxID=1522315 RepID=UPI0006D5B30A|nr:glycosyltransferase [Numidum massiliense]
MRLLYIAAGSKTLSEVDPNMISAFQQLQKERPSFAFKAVSSRREPLQRLQATIDSFRPDVVIAFKGASSPVIVERLKSKGIPVGLFVVDDPHNLKKHKQKARSFDFVMTQEASCVPFYRRHKKPALHLPLAVNPEKYYPRAVAKKYESDICFVGSALPVRLALFDKLAPFLQKKKFVIVGRWWEQLKKYAQLQRHIRNETIPPDEVAKYYNGAKIVLNIHRDNNDAVPKTHRNGNSYNLPTYTPNNRTFDIAACRAFQLTSARRDIKNFYAPNEEIVCFDGIADLKQKINYYLAHEQERKRVAALAYERTMREHTYVNRLREFVKQLEVTVVKKRN